jgi:hypothetical protein
MCYQSGDLTRCTWPQKCIFFGMGQNVPGHRCSNRKKTWLLIGGLEHDFFPYIGNKTPDWLIVFRGVGIPPTRFCWSVKNHADMPCVFNTPQEAKSSCTSMVTGLRSTTCLGVVAWHLDVVVPGSSPGPVLLRKQAIDQCWQRSIYPLAHEKT